MNLLSIEKPRHLGRFEFMRIWLSAVLGMMMLAGMSGTAEAKRVALIIANSKYAHATALRNPASDARLIAASLKQAGFDDVAVKLDLGKSAMEAELRAFGARAEGADVAMIYYAGHGIEAGGTNYLIPTDAQLARDRDLEVEATRLETVLLMADAARMKIIILDACRNNPFATTMQRSARSRAVGRGLADVEPEGETLVVYAAKGGSTAADGEGDNSPFAQALAKRLPEPGLEISLLFRAVRDDVLARTGRQQEPFTYGSLSGTAFYFKPPIVQVATGSAPPPAQMSISSEATEILFWQGAVSANTERAYRDYAARYPEGQFAGLARENLSRFIERPAPSVPASVSAARPMRASPSFGCGGKLNRVERMICNTPTLAIADRGFAEKFMAKHGGLGAGNRMDLIRWAAENRRQRDQCPTHGCILDWYGRMSNGLSGF
jgi:Caspase domain